MAVKIPQEMKSMSTIKQQPEELNSRMHLMVALDIAGYTGLEISDELEYTPQRVSTIRNSPLYKEARGKRWDELQDQVVKLKSTEISTGKQVESKIKNLAMRAVETQESLLTGSESDFVKNSVANSILDRAGHKPHTERTKISIEVTERMADRFERVLGGTRGLSNDAGKTTLRVEKEVSQ